jgi:chorismate mutase
LEETRALAANVYRETKKVQDKTIAERERAEQILKRAESLFADAAISVEECKQIERRVMAAEQRLSSALENAKKANWLKRLLGTF